MGARPWKTLVSTGMFNAQPSRTDAPRATTSKLSSCAAFR
jgi:hypothetical protein